MRPLHFLIVALPLILGGCLSRPQSIGMPEASTVLGTAGGQVTPPDCARLQEPSRLTYGGYAMPSMAFGCATYTNLAAMIARPADLTDPLPFNGGGAAAARAVRRYEENKLVPLRNSPTTRVGQ